MKYTKKIILTLILMLVLILTGCANEKFDLLKDYNYLFNIDESEAYELLDNTDENLTSNIKLKDSITVKNKEVTIRWELTSGSNYINLNGRITRDYSMNHNVRISGYFTYEESTLWIPIDFVVVGYTNTDFVFDEIKFDDSSNTVDYVTDDFTFPLIARTPEGDIRDLYWYLYEDGKDIRQFYHIYINRPIGKPGEYIEMIFTPQIQIGESRYMMRDRKVVIRVMADSSKNILIISNVCFIDSIRNHSSFYI